MCVYREHPQIQILRLSQSLDDRPQTSAVRCLTGVEQIENLNAVTATLIFSMFQKLIFVSFTENYEECTYAGW